MSSNFRGDPSCHPGYLYFATTIDAPSKSEIANAKYL